MARLGGSFMPRAYIMPLIRWTNRSPATPVPYSLQQRHRAKASGSNGFFGAVPCQVSQSRFCGERSNGGGYSHAPAYSTLLRSMGADIKVQQEWLRHSTVQSTMNVYTQAVSEQKRIANSAVVGLLFGRRAFVFANGNQQALTAAQVAFIQSHATDCYCGA